MGYITQAVIVNLAPLFFVIFQNSFGLKLSQIGQLVLLNFFTQIITDIASIKIVSKIGYRKSAVTAHVFCAAGLIMMGILPRVIPAYGGLVISVITYAVGGGLIEVIISPIVDSVPGEAKAAAMSLLHSFYCWGQMTVVLVTTIIIWIIGDVYWYILPIAWAAIPILNLINFLRVPIPEMSPESEHMNIKELFSSKIFILALIMMVCSGAAELAMSQWASMFAEIGLGVPKLTGDILGPCLFAVFMGIGRAAYGLKGNKIDLRKALIACSVLTAVCYIAAVFVKIPVISLISCALCGLGVSLMWPGMLSLTSSRCQGGTALFAILAVAGDVGCSIGPWISGVISDIAMSSETAINSASQTGMSIEQISLKSGMLAASIFPIIMIIGIIRMKKGTGNGKET